MKLFARIGAFLLALILLSSSLVGCAAMVKPLNYLKDVLEKTIQKRFGGELLEVLLDTLDRGTVTLGYGGTDLYETPLESGEATVYFDRAGQSVAAIGNVNVAGNNYDGRLFFDRDELVLCSTAFFGSTDLGVNFGTLKKDFQGSIFGNHSGNKYSRPEIGSEAAEDALTLKNGLLSLYASVDDLLSLSDEMTDEFLSILVDHAPHARYAEKGTIHVSATVNNTVFSRTLRDLRARLVKDRDFCREARELAALQDHIASIKSGIKETGWSDRVEEFIASDIGLSELCNKIDAAPAFAVTLECAVDRSARVLEQGTVTYTVDGAQQFAFHADLTDKHTNVLTLTKDGATRTLRYQVEKDGFNRYEATVDYSKKLETGEEQIHVTGGLVADRKTDSYTLTLQRGEESRVFTGSFDKMSNGFTVSVDAVSVNGEAHRLSMSLSVETGGKVAAAPDYVNLVTITEAQFDPIATRAVAARDAFKAAWGDTKLNQYTLCSYLFTVAGVPEEAPVPPAEEESAPTASNGSEA